MPTATPNKVQFGLKKVHYSVITEGTNGTTYGTPVAITGAVNLSLTINGDASPFYADNMIYYNSIANNGYTGTLEMAKIPDGMLKDVFGYTQNTAGVLMEDATVEPKMIALLFQFEGDQQEECYSFYRCSIRRPGIGSSTLNESKEPTTQSCDITAMPSQDSNILGKVYARTTSQTTASVKTGWFSTVYTG